MMIMDGRTAASIGWSLHRERQRCVASNGELIVSGPQQQAQTIEPVHDRQVSVKSGRSGRVRP